MRASFRGRSRTTVPVLLVCGVDESAMMATSLSLQLGLDTAVSVRHTIDPHAQLLTRTVSDASGVLEREVINLAHACVNCAIREDIVPTLERLAAQGRWSAIVACLPVAAEAVQVCRVIGWSPRTAPHVGIAAVVVALDGTSAGEDLVGEDLLQERGIETAQDDRRGVGEVACAQVEYADVISLTEPCDDDELALLAALARPGVPIVADPSVLDAAALAAGVHHHAAVEAWVSEVQRGELPPLPSDAVWRLDLRSERPLHPVRLHEELAIIGGGPRRSRGCFWVPTRPRDICIWDGAGGQASVGTLNQWEPGEVPMTRIVVTGCDDDPTEVVEAFARCVLRDEEIASRGTVWEESWDGLEPWLGPIHRVA